MFELNDGAIEEIIFAMEDQDHGMVIDLESGEVLARDSLEEEGLEEEGAADFADPPEWSSRDGYKLMEGFLARVRQPTVRRELQAALSRGRGVFKNFKAALAQHEEVERAFREYKTREMRQVIAAWYDDLREARGLARLGPEPEDARDLVASDFDIKLLPLHEARERLLALVREAGDEARSVLPAPVAAYEEARLVAEIESAAEGTCALADDGEGGALGAAVALKVRAEERSLGRVVFLGAREGYRRIGLGTALLEALAQSLGKEGIGLVLLDAAFVPPEFCERLSAFGYACYGSRAFSRLE